ncbi:MAG: HAMP domain-containing histidine kinase, partial [Chitinophagaceae bacterium]|nr:HAMP domain-containing histidine kinase [Chitinophagaceae bacterium]
MKIKYKINLFFTSLVSFIFCLLFIIIFYSFSLSREVEFHKRLKNRALTTINLLLNVSGIDKGILKKIDETTFIALQNKTETIYDLEGNVVFHFSDNKLPPEHFKPEYFNEISKEEEIYSINNKKNTLSLTYIKNGKTYIIVVSAYDSEGEIQKKQLVIILLFSLVVGFIIALFFGHYFAKKIVYPIRKITDNVKEISSKNLDSRIKLNDSKDELFELSSTLNDVMDRLQESFEIQGRFISNASHELLTPLTSIISQIEIALQNKRTTQEYFDTISSVYEDVLSLAQLTKALLEFAKASGNASGMELSTIRIDEILMNLPSEFKKIDPKFIVNLEFTNFPENENKLMVYGNAILLSTAIKNVVANACKYSNNHKAYVSIFFYKKSLLISVKDDGSGIKEVDLPFIYQPFYRGNGYERTNGFGLGLSLTKK